MTMKQHEQASDGLRRDLYELISEGDKPCRCMPTAADTKGLADGAEVVRRACGHAWQLARSKAPSGSVEFTTWYRIEDKDRRPVPRPGRNR